MGLFKSIKQGLDAARNPPDQAAIEESLKSLTPEQRAAYDANMARVAQGQAESQASYENAVEINDEARVLEGPAGKYLYGAAVRDVGSPEHMAARIAEVGVWQAQKEMREASKGDFKAGVRQTFNRDEVPQESDPARRQEIVNAEHAARAAARAAYRAPEAVQVSISRIATRGETQVQELTAHLGRTGIAGQPHRVYGVYRVPDRISQALTPHSEKGRVVEWDVVHAQLDAAAPVPAPAVTSFAADDQWVSRRIGEPSVLDEDLGVAFLQRAGVGPERSLGLARVCEFRSLRGHGSEGDSGNITTLVRGLLALHPTGLEATYEAMRAEAPLPLPAEPDGVVAEVLNWGEIARAVRPKIHHPHTAPSPFPYLPSTPQELLLAYLEVVGLRPEDCYSAQCTVHHVRELIQGGVLTTNLGPKQPTADGKDRMRSHGCEQVVVVYRDHPDYVAGRERWEAYQRDVLNAGLHKGVGVRRTVSIPDDIADAVPVGLRTIARAAELIDRVEYWGVEDVPPYRYCWPPVG